jgi:uncharacterized membrane protein
MALVLYQPLFWLSLLLLAGFTYWLARKRQLHWWPAWITRLVLCGLILFSIFSPRGELFQQELPNPEVMVLDQSDSLAPDQRAYLFEQALQWRQEQVNRMVVVFGDQPDVILQNTSQASPVDGRGSHMLEALQMAERLLERRAGKITILSDGLVNSPELVTQELAHLQAQELQLEIIEASPRSAAGDGSVWLYPTYPTMWEGTPFDLVAQVHPPQPELAPELSLKINTYPVEVSPQPIGENLYRIAIPAQPAGILTLELAVQFPGSAAIQVYPSPDVLLVSDTPEAVQATRFVENLTANGLRVTMMMPADVPTDLSQLENYRVILTHNLLASSLSKEQMLTLRLFVTRMGGGLIFLGGRNSYTLGGYQDTVLEPLLPVKMEPPPRSQRNPVTFVIVMDRSASMRVTSEGQFQPIVLAREAAMRAIENLGPQDTLGVLAFSDSAEWRVELGPVGDGLRLRQALDRVSAVSADGSTMMHSALKKTLEDLMATSTSTAGDRYILLLSDGKSYDGNQNQFEELANLAAEQNITISTIALGVEADQKMLSIIADIAQGRFHVVQDAQDLPQIMITESQAARSENIQTGETNLALNEEGHPMLSGLSVAQLPKLQGYNAVASKSDQGAEDVLVSANFNDPLFSIWQIGLGRVAAWMSDLGEEWSGDFSDPAAAGRFWSQAIRYTLPSPAVSPTQVDVTVDGPRLVVAASLQETDGALLNGVSAQFSYLQADGQTRNFRVPQIAPGNYRLELPAPEVGAYHAALTYQSGGVEQEIPAAFTVNAPVEWQALDQQQSKANLIEWANVAQTTLAEATSLTMEPPETEASPATQSDIWFTLLLIALVFWPLEIAMRRKWLPWI